MNSYNVKCEDPSSTNALNTSIYVEINEIKNVNYKLLLFRNSIINLRL